MQRTSIQDQGEGPALGRSMDARASVSQVANEVESLDQMTIIVLSFICSETWSNRSSDGLKPSMSLKQVHFIPTATYNILMVTPDGTPAFGSSSHLGVFSFIFALYYCSMGPLVCCRRGQERNEGILRACFKRDCDAEQSLQFELQASRGRSKPTAK